MLLLWLAGCAQESDVDRYYRLTTGTGEEPARIAACLMLSGESLQGECQLDIARQSADMAALCPLMAGSVWQSECYFMAAEQLRQTDPEQAGALCLRSAAFRNECIQHLWQTDLMILAKRSSRAFPVTVPQADLIYERWASLAEGSDMAVRFWRLFYLSAFKRSRFLQPSHCTPLPEAHEARCRKEAAVQYALQLREASRFPRARAVICALAPVTSAQAAQTRVPELQAEPAAELDAVLAEVHGQLCEDGQPRADFEALSLPGFEE